MMAVRRPLDESVPTNNRKRDDVGVTGTRWLDFRRHGTAIVMPSRSRKRLIVSQDWHDVPRFVLCGRPQRVRPKYSARLRSAGKA
jgi:hypothetical protein